MRLTVQTYCQLWVKHSFGVLTVQCTERQSVPKKVSHNQRLFTIKVACVNTDTALEHQGILGTGD